MKGQMNAEDEFNSLMSKYDWYYEMSDDPRAYDRGTAMNSKLKMLGKQIGVDKAIELFNSKAPSDRKITSSFFMEGEDKHSKIKEALKAALKKALKEEDPAMARIEKDEEAAEKALAQILTKKAAVLAKPGTQG
jgi:RIO-like serine/threonine protein kinase